MRLAVIMGGDSPEREVSLKTGAAMVAGLKRLGHEVLEYDIDVLSGEALLQAGAELVLLALHGGKGENGSVQGALEVLGLPYTGSGVLASAVAMDKLTSKRLFALADLPTPEWISPSSPDDEALADFCRKHGWPVVAKPSGLGSTIGISIVREPDQLRGALQEAFSYDSTVLVEKFVLGREMTVAVLDGETPTALPVVEIIPREGFYDYEAKYNTAQGTQYRVPADIPEDLGARLGRMAIEAFQLLGCRDLARVDFIVGEDEAWLLEVNTLPGMTGTSLVPKAAAAAGISFDELLQRMVDSALTRRRHT